MNFKFVIKVSSTIRYEIRLLNINSSLKFVQMVSFGSNNDENTSSKHTESFHYVFKTLTTNKDQILEIPVEIPYPGLIPELTQRIIKNFDLPCYLEDGEQISRYNNIIFVSNNPD